MDDIDRWLDPNDLGNTERFLQCHKRTIALLELVGQYAPDRNSKILDVGCGCGRDILALRNAGYGLTFGVDVNEAARGLVPDVYLIFGRIPDVLNYADGTFELAYSWTTLQHLSPAQLPITARRLLDIAALVVVIECELQQRHDYIWAHDYRDVFERAGAVQLHECIIDTRGEPFGGIYTARVFRSNDATTSGD